MANPLNLTILSDVTVSVKVTAGKETEQKEAIQSILSELTEPERIILAKALKNKSLKSKAILYLKTFIK